MNLINAEADRERVFPGDSEMARRMRALDWTKTALGPPEHWPENLRIAVSLCLTSRIPIVMYWGRQFTVLYNDPYISFLGQTKHPRYLGQPGNECWSEIWDTIGPMLESVWATGAATGSENVLMFFSRHLPLEEVYVRFTFGPILGADGRTVEGIFCPCTETTDQVVGARRLETLRKLSEKASEARTLQEACNRAAAALLENPKDVPFAAIYLINHTGTEANLAAAAGLAEETEFSPLPRCVALLDAGPAAWPIPSVFHAQRAEEVDLAGLNEKFPGSPWPEPAARALVLPISDSSAGALAGLLIVGVSTRRVLDSSYRIFFDLVAGQISALIANAAAFEEKKTKAEALAEITRREAGARELSQELQTIYNTIPLGMCLLDRELRFVRINDRLADMNGIPALEHIGKTIREIVPALADQVEAKFLRIMETGTPLIGVELTGETKAQPGVERIWLESWYPQRDGSERVVGVNVVAQDITELKRAEESLRESDRRKDEFLATLSHELRNPIAPIQNAVQILKTIEATEPRLEWCRDVIEQQIGYMARLMEDLLDVSRITRNKLELRKQPIDLRESIRDAVAISSPAMAAAGHKLTVILPPESMPLHADSTRLTQVFVNILNNAAKYMDKSGQIWLGVKLEPGKKNPDAKEAVVRIKDNGIGISGDLLSRIFDLFAQADATSERSKGGLGIGLTLARHLVDLHGGSIQATSEGLGKGSEFIVRLPLAELGIDLDAGSRRAPQARSKIPSYKRILVVDDVRIQAKSMGMLLELMGFEVRIAHNGPGALAALQEFLPDVALIDIGLPEINGYEVARRIRALPQFKDILLIAQTGWGRDTDRERARQAGFDYHLTKPIDHQRLEKILTGRADPRDTSAELNSSK